ncbi:MarR family winged helix-turn-helix transcriptional regulator [Paenibacillus daejeonensis]|uniref:MarR family winged helix-turn-helix transcriptional regulator n=1 Tax=Paenibacillus daejeonensis TaxID=135193 RepID=UPI00036F9F17|nr:MarR family transcriptional regulator [Paenibacillus daejeonensis]
MHSEMEQFVAHLQRVNRHLRSSVFEGNQQPVTRVQWLLMRHLKRSGGSTIGQLAERLDVRASTMSQMLDRLEKQGYLVRQQDPADARVKLIRLTEEGHSVIAQTEKHWLDSLAEPFNKLEPEEREQLARLMQRLADQIQGGE